MQNTQEYRRKTNKDEKSEGHQQKVFQMFKVIKMKIKNKAVIGAVGPFETKLVRHIQRVRKQHMAQRYVKKKHKNGI